MGSHQWSLGDLHIVNLPVLLNIKSMRHESEEEKRTWCAGGN